MDVGGPPGIVMVAPGIGPGTDGHEAVTALRVGEGVPAAREVGVEGRVVLVDAVEVAPGGVGLPELDQRVGGGPAVFVQDPAGDDDALAGGTGRVLPGQVEGLHVHRVRPEHRPRHLGERVGERDERLGGRPLQRGPIGRMQVAGLRSGLRPPVAQRPGHLGARRSATAGALRRASAVPSVVT